MARDKQARKYRRDASLLDRRDYLKATGTAIVGAFTAAGAATTTAQAASSVGPNWELRDRYVETGRNELGIGCAVTDPDGEGVIEHVYVRSTASSDKPGIWVDPNRHVGHLTVRNVHVEGHADNAIYAECAPPHGAGGTVTVEDCYLHDNTRGNLRVNGGTEVRNTHIHNTGQNFPSHGYVSAGYYSYYAGRGDITMRHCQIDMDGSNARNGSDALALMTRGSTSAYGDYGSNVPTVDVYDSQVSGEVDAHDGNINLHGSGSSPRIDPPKGVPMTAEEARNGTSSATGPTWAAVRGGSSGGSETESDADSESDSSSSGNDSRGTVLELVASQDAQGVTYEFTVDGRATRHTVDADVAAEDGDSVTDNGDGTVTVTGVAGNGYGDAFVVDGAITAMRLDESQWTLRYGGAQTSVAGLTGSDSGSGSGSGTDSDSETGDRSDSDAASGSGDRSNTLVIDGTNSPDEACNYRFAVSGSAEKSGALGSINAYDEVSDGAITGRVIAGTDAYRFSGEITEFAVDGPVAVRLESRT